MVQKIHPRGVIWVPSISPHAGRLSEKKDDLAVQYEDVRVLTYLMYDEDGLKRHGYQADDKIRHGQRE